MSGPPEPQRVPADPADAQQRAAALSQQLRTTTERAAKFGDDDLHRGVNGEWSTVQSLRHLVMVIDVWLSKTIAGEDDPFHPIGLPPHFVGATIPGSSIDPDANPTFAEACAVLDGRLARVREFAASVTEADLARAVGTHAKTVAGALGVVFDELAAHDSFVNRDLDLIEGA